MRITLQPSFILHSRPYGDTSVIVDIFASDHGRLSLLAKGQRSAGTGKRRPLAVFAPMLLSWQGRGDLKLLTAAELSGPSSALVAERLYCAFYLNELLIRLLPPQDPHPRLFAAYAKLLTRLVEVDDVESHLRQFELTLLDELGYGIQFDCDADSGETLAAGHWYNFLVDSGFVKVKNPTADQQRRLFSGEVIAAIARQDFSAPEARRGAKKLTRLALAPHLGSKPLKSRELFMRSER